MDEIKREADSIKLNEDPVLYLQDTIGTALAKGLAVVVAEQPHDAVGFLATWLRKYANSKDKRTQLLTGVEKTFFERRQKSPVQDGRTNMVSRASPLCQDKANLENLLSNEDLLFIKLQETTLEWYDDRAWQNLVNYIHKITKSTGAYIAVYNKDVGDDSMPEESAGLRYISANEDHRFMLDEILLEDEGITWEALVDHREFEEEDDDDGAADSEKMDNEVSKDIESSDNRYQMFYVEDAIEQDKLKFFRMTRPGSFAALPLVYEKTAHPEALSAAVQHLKETLEKEKAKELAKLEPKASDDEKSGTEATENEIPLEEVESSSPKTSPKEEQQKEDSSPKEEQQKEDSSPEEEQEKEDSPRPFVLPKELVKMVVCVDSLGQDRSLDGTTLSRAVAILRAVQKNIERLEELVVMHQAEEKVGFSGSVPLPRQDIASYIEAADTEISMEISKQLEANKLHDSTLGDNAMKEEVAHVDSTLEDNAMKEEVAHVDSTLEDNAVEEEVAHIDSTLEDNDEKEDADHVDSTLEDNDEKEDVEEHVDPGLVRKIKLDSAGSLIDKLRLHVLYLGKLRIEEPGCITAVSTALIILGHTASHLRLNPRRTDSPIDWSKCRTFVEESWIDKIISFDPNPEPEKYSNTTNCLKNIYKILIQDTELTSEKEQEPDEDDSEIKVNQEKLLPGCIVLMRWVRAATALLLAAAKHQKTEMAEKEDADNVETSQVDNEIDDVFEGLEDLLSD